MCIIYAHRQRMGRRRRRTGCTPTISVKFCFFFCLFGFLFFFRFENKKTKKKFKNQTNEIGRGIVTLTHDEPTQQPKNRKKGEFLLSSHTHAYQTIGENVGDVSTIPINKKINYHFISFWLLHVHLSTANFYEIANMCRDVVPTYAHRDR